MSGKFEFKTIEDMEAYWYRDAAQYLTKADDPVLTTTANVYQAIFGAKVWVNLNLEANVFGAIPKEPWGRHSGVRVFKARSYDQSADPAGPANPSENGTLPETRKPDVDSYTIKPKPVVDNFDVSEIQQFLGAVDDSLGDTLGTYREYFAKEHVEKINRQLTVRVEDFDSTKNFITSLDQIISSDLESGELTTPSNADVFGLDRSGAAGPFDSYVDNNDAGANAARAYSNGLLDTAFTELWIRGARPSVILTGYRTWQKMKADTIGAGIGSDAGASTVVRYVDPSATVTVAPGVNGIRSVQPGVEGALQLGTYNGVPILQSKDIRAEAGVTTEAEPIYIADTQYLGYRTAKPTQYFEAGLLSGDPFVVNRLGQEGMYRTLGETFSRWLAVQGKITHILK